MVWEDFYYKPKTSKADIISWDENQNISKSFFFFLGIRLNEVRLK